MVSRVEVFGNTAVARFVITLDYFRSCCLRDLVVAYWASVFLVFGFLFSEGHIVLRHGCVVVADQLCYCCGAGVDMLFG